MGAGSFTAPVNGKYVIELIISIGKHPCGSQTS